MTNIRIHKFRAVVASLVLSRNSIWQLLFCVILVSVDVKLAWWQLELLISLTPICILLHMQSNIERLYSWFAVSQLIIRHSCL